MMKKEGYRFSSSSSFEDLLNKWTPEAAHWMEYYHPGKETKCFLVGLKSDLIEERIDYEPEFREKLAPMLKSIPGLKSVSLGGSLVVSALTGENIFELQSRIFDLWGPQQPPFQQNMSEIPLRKTPGRLCHIM